MGCLLIKRSRFSLLRAPNQREEERAYSATAGSLRRLVRRRIVSFSWRPAPGVLLLAQPSNLFAYIYRKRFPVAPSRESLRAAHSTHARKLPASMKEFRQRENMPATFSSHNLLENWRPEAATAIYRIAQEALRNVSKHAGKTHVKMVLSGSGTGLQLKVMDFGLGDLIRKPICPPRIRYDIDAGTCPPHRRHDQSSVNIGTGHYRYSGYSPRSARLGCLTGKGKGRLPAPDFTNTVSFFPLPADRF
jgi:hypothetical protein